MRIPVPLAWVILALALFTAGILRQFHDATPRSPFLHPIAGSLLFAAIFLVLLVAAREWRLGSVRGPGIRLGSLTPILLMLLIEKWVAIWLYRPTFGWLAEPLAPPRLLDAQYRAFAGAGLLLVCVLLARFSAPTSRKTWRRLRPSRWAGALAGLLIVLPATYAALALVVLAVGGGVHLAVPQHGALLAWMLGGQSILALAEEVYFRGLLLGEVERIAPRLGVRQAAVRRWLALGATALLFGMEHLDFSASWDATGRQLVFTVSLGLLLGMMIMVSHNLLLAAGLHAWINWLLLGAAPRFVDGAGRPLVPSGTFIGLALILTFALLLLVQRRRHGPASHRAG